MKYFIDTEFHEYKKQPKLLGLKIGKPIDTIELISIGIVAEDSREYYTVCNEFDLKEAWDNEWLRKNVIQDVWKDLVLLESPECTGMEGYWFNYDEVYRLLAAFGKSRKQIAEEIRNFVYYKRNMFNTDEVLDKATFVKDPVNFYAYYADYDWVVFCWLFGRMIDLPKGFPMYCKDLKQISDEVYDLKKTEAKADFKKKGIKGCFLNSLSEHLSYPKQENEHNALDDAKWNKKLYEFIKGLC